MKEGRKDTKERRDDQGRKDTKERRGHGRKEGRIRRKEESISRKEGTKEGKRDRAKPDGKAGCKKTKKNGWEGFVLKYPYWLTIWH